MTRLARWFAPLILFGILVPHSVHAWRGGHRPPRHHGYYGSGQHHHHYVDGGAVALGIAGVIVGAVILDQVRPPRAAYAAPPQIFGDPYGNGYRDGFDQGYRRGEGERYRDGRARGYDDGYQAGRGY